MKKLSLLFFAVCASVMSWAQDNSTAGLAYTLNPYAYDLAIKSWDPVTRLLTVQFKLNAPPNLDDNGTDNNGPYNTGIADNEPNGIQIYAVDQSGNEYRIGGLGRPDIQKGIADGSFEYTMNLSAGTSVEFKGTAKPLPLDEPLTWKVRVKGRSNKTAAYQKPRHITARPSGHKRPRYTLGVDVGNKPLSPNFGKIFITEVSDGSKNLVDNTSLQGHATWGWLYDALYDANYTVDGGGHKRMPALLEYTPQLLYKTLHKKYKHDGADSWFSGTPYYEPHRVRVSDDGRIFVTSHHTNAGAAVMEYKGNNQFITIIDFDRTNVVTGTNAKFNRRVVSMDVKGSGPDLKILVAWIDADAATKNGKKCAQIQCWEYPIGTSESKHTHNSGTKIAEFNDLTYTSGSGINDGTGLLYRGYLNTWNGGNLGFVEVAYGNGNNNPVWLKIDYSYGTVAPGQLLYFENGALKYTNTMNSSYHYNSYYGGNSLLIKGDTLITTGGQRLQLYEIGSNGQLSELPNPITSTEFGAWTNGLALDYANNLYGVSEYTGRLITVALPYSGVVETPAPTNSTFTIAKPVPNILATDLRCEPHATQNRYIFSFNTNTKPEEAQIRFYYSYEDMQKSLNVVNADNYNGTNANKPAFVYNIPDGKLKQGRIEVELGGVCGKLDANNVIINDSLPAGVLYWSVYVKTRESSAFAPIYEQSTTGEDAHHRLHATVNNYPETDGFGHIYAVNYYAEFDAKNGLMEYSFNPNGNSNDEQNNIKNANRYKLVKNYLNPTGSKPKFTNQRRLAVAPDGKVYIADCGQSYSFDANADRPWMFKGGGVFVWNPNTQTGNEIQISLFSTKDQYSTATGVDIYNHNGQMKLYATNTYGEFENHYTGQKYWKNYQYTEANQADVNIYGWNGFKEFNLGTPNNILLEETTGTVLRSLGMGDGNGNIGIVATDKGIWLAQHRLNDVQYTIDVFKANNSKKPALPDNTENYILSFVPYGSNTRTWTSCSTRGINYSGSTYDQNGASELTQLPSSPLQACPGAGLAYRKTNGKEFLYIVNHQGNIVELQITSWSGTTPSVKYIKTYPGSGPKEAFLNTGRLQGVINTMCFDYAGNLITTSGLEYLGSTSTQHIIVYTMPYDRVNAREIQAPNSCRMIPERIAHLDMGARELDLVIKGHQGHAGCAIDLYRPLQGAMFNTICLPFELNLGSLPADHPLKNAKLQAYTELKLETVGGEKMLELVFTDVNDNIIRANTPYIIRPENDEGINHIIRFDGPLVLTDTTGKAVRNTEAGGTYSITYRGIVPFQLVQPTFQDGESLILMLVADNRLAEMTAQGNMLGFRGYFQLHTPLPRGMQTRITTQKPVATNTTIVVDGKKVNVEKFLREGRVCIRVGETLYNMNGEIIER